MLKKYKDGDRMYVQGIRTWKELVRIVMNAKAAGYSYMGYKEVLPEEKFRRYKFGQGPNWKMRTVRDALKLLGFTQNILEIKWKRGYYICPLATNWREYLLGECEKPTYDLQSIEELKNYWLERWILPRKEYLQGKLYMYETEIRSPEVLVLK